jgi:hypothetical protein
VSISSKRNFKATGSFCTIIPSLTSTENGILLFMRQNNMINREQRSAELQRYQSSFVDQIFNRGLKFGTRLFSLSLRKGQRYTVTRIEAQNDA